MKAAAAWASDEEDDEARTPEILALLGGIRAPSSKKVLPLPSSSSSAALMERGGGDGGGEGGGGGGGLEDDGSQVKLGRLSLGEKLAFGLPNLATAAMYLPTSIHINKFFADTLLVPPGTLALATALARGFDTVLDPFFGWLSDNTTTRWGRRKPYIAFGAPLSALFYFLLFTPPASLSPAGAANWFCIFFALFLAIPLSLPHHALGPELTLDYGERSSLYAWAEGFSLVGVILAAAAPGVMAQYISDTRTIFFLMSATVAVLLVLTFAVLLYVVEEPHQANNDGNPLVPGLRRAWRNRPFRVLVLTSVIGSVAHHCSSLLFPFFISYVLHPQHDALWLSACLLVYFGCSALSIPMWCWLAQHYDKKHVWLAGWFVHLPASFCMFFLPPGATVSLIGLTACTGLSFGGSSYLYKAIQADAIDYDELRTTRRREGQYITFWALIPKLVAIPSASIPLIVLEQAGYVANRHPQSPEVVMTIRTMTTILPCVLSAFALLMAYQYPINKHVSEQVIEKIDRRRRAIHNGTPLPAEEDPVTGRPLPEISGGLTTLTSEFCWYLDYFSEEELQLVLRRGQRALVWSVTWSIYAAVAIAVAAGTFIYFGSTAIKVVGVMGVSFALAVGCFHWLRLQAAKQFTQEKIHTFRRGRKEYFSTMLCSTNVY